MPPVPATAHASRLMRRVRALRAIAEGSTSQHEAEAAALKAQELLAMTRLHRPAEEADGAPNTVDDTVVSSGRVPAWKQALLNVLAPHFRCKCYTVKIAGIGNVALHLIGRRRDIDVTREVWVQTAEAAARISLDYSVNRPASNPDAMSPRTSWCDGFVDGLAERLAAQRSRNAWGVALVPDDDVRRAIESLRLRPHRGAAVSHAEDAYAAGRSRGSRHAVGGSA